MNIAYLLSATNKILFHLRAAEHEIAALSQMAEQLKHNRGEAVTESVDLDNLFAFLSDVQPQNRNQIIEEIGEKMNELVEDLDVELETVIQQELEGLAQEQAQPTPPKMNIPTLPEPTGTQISTFIYIFLKKRSQSLKSKLLNIELFTILSN